MREEHPKPQFMRDNIEILNGKWQFETDCSDSGIAREMFLPDKEFSMEIEVPFCPESSLSGIGNKDFMFAVWYKRTINITKEQLDGLIFLHFGAVDYFSVLYINGKECGQHKGGYVSFKFDITEHVKEGENVITLYVRDDTRNIFQPTGKQSTEYNSFGCFYTRTTGIWQTVWLEFCPQTHIENFRFYPDFDGETLTVQAKLSGEGEFSVSTSFEGRNTGCKSLNFEGGIVTLTVDLTEKIPWEINKGNLYDVVLKFGDDVVKSYFGLRKIEYKNMKFYLNDKSVFQRLILDQGFYPDGIYTAPNDNELLGDIKRAKAMGFNGARLHQKVFEERFLYHCDKEGYIVWGEYPNWGVDHSQEQAIYSIVNEWIEEVERDFNHPSVVGWCPLNETWDFAGRKQCDDFVKTLYEITKAIDPTRPVIDTSGNYHVVTDIYDVHCYEHNSTIFYEKFKDLKENCEFTDWFDRQHYRKGQPFFVSEYGGIKYGTQGGWGYGKNADDEDAILNDVKALTDVLLDNPNIFAFCYTQLTDIEQEQNGLYYFDRCPKIDPEKIYPIFARKAKAEE